MNKTKFFIYSILFLLSFSYAQTKAITSDGKSVLLNKDKTWKYVEEKETSFEGMGIWKIKYFVDDFGDPTDEGYVVSEALEGKFSNSATTDSQLLAFFIIDDSDITLKLFEYGSQMVKGSISRITCYTSIKHNGVKLDGYLVANNYQDRFVFNYEGKEALMKMFKEGGSLAFVMDEVSDYGSSRYSFKIKNTDGFSNAYKTLFPSTD